MGEENKSSVLTIPRKIVEQIAEKRISENTDLLRVAQLVNRSLPIDDYEDGHDKGLRLRRGMSIARQSGLTHTYPETVMRITENKSGAQVEYHGRILPLHHGEEIIWTIQDKLNSALRDGNLNAMQTTRLAALMAIAVSTAHIFPDGSGRTAIALADVVIQKIKHRRLDLRLIDQDDEQLTQILIHATSCLYMDDFELKTAMNKAKRNKKTNLITLPTNMDTITDFLARGKFEQAMAMNLIDAIESFDLGMDPSKAEVFTFPAYVIELSRFFTKRLEPKQ